MGRIVPSNKKEKSCNGHLYVYVNNNAIIVGLAKVEKPCTELKQIN